jgi:electron transport complex protein RnfE
MSVLPEFSKGIYKQNPVFKQALGLCPTLAVTNSVYNGLGMGLAATFVLIGSNVIVSLIHKGVPNKIRIPIYIVVIASFVTVVDLVMAGFQPALHKALGIFVPLIVVNCIILGRAEAFASKNPVTASIADALGISLGFALALIIISLLRQILGTGNLTIADNSLFTLPLLGEHPLVIFILPPGAFLVIGLLLALFRRLGWVKSD